jgi:hypothetical protein
LAEIGIDAIPASWRDDIDKIAQPLMANPFMGLPKVALAGVGLPWMRRGVPNSAAGMSDLARARAELRLLDTSDFTNAQKGALGEARASLTNQRAGYAELEARLPSNNGFDGVFVKYDVDGITPTDISINESKFTSTGRASLSNTNMGRQMSPEWIDANIQKMRFSDNPAVVDTARLLRNNSELIRVKANVLNEQGLNRWNMLKLPE